MEAVIFTGLQATGKSEFYKQRFFKTHVRINLDMLRTRRREDILLKACLEAKQPFVIDNTNPAAIERQKYIQAAKNAHFKVVGYYFQSSLAAAVSRNEQREGKERVPRPALLGTYNKLELPQKSEGFDELFYVQLDGKGGFTAEEFIDEV